MRTKTQPSDIFDGRYPARRVLSLIGDKWTPIVLYCLSGGVRRFNEMQHRIPDISKKMLIQVLRKLEADGLVNRKVYPVVPPKPNIPSPRLVNGSMSPWRSSAAGPPQTQICWTKSTPGAPVERPSAESSHQLSRSSMSVRESPEAGASPLRQEAPQLRAPFCAPLAKLSGPPSENRRILYRQNEVRETQCSVFPIYRRLPKLDVNPVVGSLAGSGTINALASGLRSDGRSVAIPLASPNRRRVRRAPVKP
jgi:DNA-binding HxlR family transcriptional regulator